tara:strand:+ start:3648 stop:4487 length:840 start_codon:yes stop_codon:yes gene_type:complete
MEILEKNIKRKKQIFQDYCIKNQSWIETFILPFIQKKSKKESILIEFRNLNHLDFIIRNCIRVLGNEWSHTIICGTENIKLIENIVQKINRPINIIKYNFKNISRLEYSLLLLNSDFYKQFHGEHLLFYQEDTIIFKNISNKFFTFDFIGAPVPNKKNLFNGGFSLRNKNKMIEICKQNYDKIIDKFQKSRLFLEKKEKILKKKYINFKINPKFKFLYFIEKFLLEDILICKKCTKLPTFSESRQFSVEKYNFKNPVGGHQFWYAIDNIELWLDINLKQ